ncbi:MAG TPA: hypothetical protein VD833_10730 [Vicinamibacterales bacterium]|nr:hypothetical protein [Vicinamibacterales bacterium]
MRCRSCGTEIADRAIVCFRCGAATVDPVRRAVPVKSRRPILSLGVMIVLVLLALYLGQASTRAGDPEGLQVVAGLCAGGALAVLLLRVMRRRSR